MLLSSQGSENRENFITSFNYRLIKPEKNLVTREDCLQSDESSFLKFEDSFSDEVLKTTIGEASEGK